MYKYTCTHMHSVWEYADIRACPGVCVWTGVVDECVQKVRIYVSANIRFSVNVCMYSFVSVCVCESGFFSVCVSLCVAAVYVRVCDRIICLI